MAISSGTRWPAYLLERAVRAPDLELGVVAGSTPVVAFGDPVAADVATLGINPSAAEFLDPGGRLLEGSDRRLATLKSLGVDGYDEVTLDHAAAIVDDCASYFDRRPYKWFSILDHVIREALGVSYRERSACHLDLVQWATTSFWGELGADVQAELLRQDVGFLRRQLHASHYRLVVVNGRSAMSWVASQRIVAWHPVLTLEGPPRADVSVGWAGDTCFVGWSCNLQSQHGARRHASQLAEILSQEAGRHLGGPPAFSPRPAAPVAADGRDTLAPAPRPRGGDGAGAGSVPKGLHFQHKSELVSYLAGWLDRSSDPTIGGVGSYGGSGWITVDSEAGLIGINRDTTREAVEALVLSTRTPRTQDWLVVANRTGRINRVLFSDERTPGWYAYLRQPLERETRVGVGHRTGTNPASTDARLRPRRPEAAPSVPASTPRRSARSASSRHVPPTPPPRPPLPPPSSTFSSVREAAIVQFPHPGGEHVPAGRSMPWNRGDHARKFLCAPGTFVADDGELRGADLVFWGEWEPPSRVVHRWSPRAGLPTVLHEPFWRVPDDVGPRQNTDPWVFGDTFLYSNCKQLTPAKGPSGLQRLGPGALILFGSGLAGEFVIDTVFVVGEVVAAYSPAHGPQLPVDPAFETCTIASLASLDAGFATATYILYRGATLGRPVNGMFSFVPCRRRADHDARFARPAVRLPGVVNPRSTQSPSGAKDRRPINDVVDAWHQVVAQVRSQGLDLAVQIATPRRHDD